MDITQGKKLSSDWLANIAIIGQFVYLVGGEWKRIIVLARYKFYFIRIHDNIKVIINPFLFQETQRDELISLKTCK